MGCPGRGRSPGVLAAISLVAIFLNEAYRPGVYGVAIYYVLGILYFAIAGRNRLVLSPEEEFALTQGEHGIPQEAGYATSREEQEAILGGGAPSARALRRRSRHRRRPPASGRASRTNGGPVVGPAVRV